MLVCDADPLPPGNGAEATITVTATTAAPATLSAIAVTMSETLDPDRTDNTARIDLTALDDVP